MEYVLTDVLSRQQIDLCKEVALNRVNEHMSDAKNGDPRALNTNGGRGKLSDRSRAERLKQGLMGTLGECLGSIFTRCEWTMESGQYKGNKNPDLGPIFRGKRVICEVRSREEDTCLYRPQHDRHRPDVLYVAVTKLPFGPFRIYHAFFRDLIPLVDKHPEWMRAKNSPTPFYAIPSEYFSEDFSEFGTKTQ